MNFNTVSDDFNHFKNICIMPYEASYNYLIAPENLEIRLFSASSLQQRVTEISLALLLLVPVINMIIYRALSYYLVHKELYDWNAPDTAKNALFHAFYLRDDTLDLTSYGKEIISLPPLLSKLRNLGRLQLTEEQITSLNSSAHPLVRRQKIELIQKGVRNGGDIDNLFSMDLMDEVLQGLSEVYRYQLFNIIYSTNKESALVNLEAFRLCNSHKAMIARGLVEEDRPLLLKHLEMLHLKGADLRIIGQMWSSHDLAFILSNFDRFSYQDTHHRYELFKYVYQENREKALEMLQGFALSDQQNKEILKGLAQENVDVMAAHINKFNLEEADLQELGQEVLLQNPVFVLNNLNIFSFSNEDFYQLAIALLEADQEKFFTHIQLFVLPQDGRLDLCSTSFKIAPKETLENFEKFMLLPQQKSEFIKKQAYGFLPYTTYIPALALEAGDKELVVQSLLEVDPNQLLQNLDTVALSRESLKRIFKLYLKHRVDLALRILMSSGLSKEDIIDLLEQGLRNESPGLINVILSRGDFTLAERRRFLLLSCSASVWNMRYLTNELLGGIAFDSVYDEYQHKLMSIDARYRADAKKSLLAFYISTQLQEKNDLFRFFADNGFLLYLLEIRSPSVRKLLVQTLLKISFNSEDLPEQILLNLPSNREWMQVLQIAYLGLIDRGIDITTIPRLTILPRAFKDAHKFNKLLTFVLHLAHSRKISNDIITQILTDLYQDPTKMAYKLSNYSILMNLGKESLIHRPMTESFEEVFESTFGEYWILPKPIDNFWESFLPFDSKSRMTNSLLTFASSVNKHSGTNKYRELLGSHIASLLEDSYAENRYSREDSPHLERISEDTVQKWSINKVTAHDGYNCYFTDKPEDLLLCATEVSTCLSIISGENNRALLGYLMNGQNKLLAIKKSANGPILARSTIRLLLDENQPVIFVEKTYGISTWNNAEIHEVLLSMAKEIASELGLPLLHTGYGEEYPNPIRSLGGKAPDYSDAAKFGSVSEDGTFTIQDASIVPLD